MLKAGFIGFGRMGITHFSILNTHPAVTITAISESSRTMRSVIKKYLNTTVYTDYRKMIQKEDLDFIIVSTPADSHQKIIEFAINNNLHIFTEKPFVLNAVDGFEVLKLLNGKAIVNQVGYVNRFNKIFIEIKKLVKEGVIGQVKNFSSEMYGATVLKDSKSTWRGKRSSGGGCVYEFASHCIDLAIYLFGQPESVAGSVMQKVYSSRVEDIVSTTLLYHNDLYGYVMVNWSDQAYRSPTNIIKIFGTKGKIIANRHEYKIYLREDNPNKRIRKGWSTRFITDIAAGTRFYVRGNEFTDQLDYFIECIDGVQLENVSGFAEALKTDVVMEKIIEDSLISQRRGANA
jgi:predicted dehydrogenase